MDKPPSRSTSAHGSRLPTEPDFDPRLPRRPRLREYLPLKVGDSVVAVVGIWRDATPILGQLDEVRREVIFVTLSAAVLAAILLFLVFRSAQGRISRGTALLLEAGRRDPLTGTLNHGSLVEALTAAIETAAHGRAHRRDRPPRHRQLPAPERDPRPHRG